MRVRAKARAGVRVRARASVLLLHLSLRVEPLDHESVDVPHADGRLDIRLLEQIVAHAHLVRGRGRVRGWGYLGVAA